MRLAGGRVESVTRTSGTDRSASARSRVRALAGRGLQVSPWLLIAVAVGIVFLGQLVEDLTDSQPLQMLTPVDSSKRWTLVAVVLYELAIALILVRTVQRSVPALQRVIRCDPEAFGEYVSQMALPGPTVGAGLLAVSALITTVLFVALGVELPLTDDPVTNEPLYLSDGVAGSLAILAGYTVVAGPGCGSST
jgi:hypothetical protein